ncbi:hypothetical protein [Azospirillum sp. A39]|uniref:hypothetical protein n=1 Tax=Azospirillum sp. A39 TaxID=3462279 RepID=UPI0040455B3A
MGAMGWFFSLFPMTPAAPAELRLVEAAGVTVDADEEQWRPLGTDARRDLAPMAQRRMHELAAYLWESNRLANRLIELPLAYLLGEGVSLSADDDEAQGWLDAFWFDPINRLDRKLEAKMRAMALFGEQLWPVFVNEVSGHVRLGYCDPGLIESVITDPENGEQTIAVVVRRDGGRRKVYRVIVPGGTEDDLFPPGSGARRLRDGATGDAFYYRINDLPNSRRGRSDLLSAIDWCDAYEQLLFGELERASALRSFIWDVTIKGGTPAEVEDRARSIGTPKPLSVRVHNDSEEWKPLSASLGSYEADRSARTIRTHVLGGSTIPEHWYGSGEDVNRASAEEMGGPAEKVLTLRQHLWKGILEDIGSYVIARRLAAIGADVKALGAEPEYRAKASFPELTAKDTTKYAAALGQVATAATVLIDKGLLSEETAVHLVASIAGRLGVDIDAGEELAKARTAADERAAEDAFSLPPEEPADGAGDA